MLKGMNRFEEAKALLRKKMPVAERVLGGNARVTFTMRWIYAQTLYKNGGATLDDLREAANILEETTQNMRRVLGSAHPVTKGMEDELKLAREALRARESS